LATVFLGAAVGFFARAAVVFFAAVFLAGAFATVFLVDLRPPV
jgi:hypothetical protein